MKLTVRDRYLVVPINTNVGNKKLLFLTGEGKIAFDLVAPIDAVHPKYYSYINVERFLGRELELRFEPEVEFSCSFASALPESDPENSRRPLVHYTACRGWLSDPNGLFWYEGLYHLFYQFNPASPLWGCMHWGHAVSSDLIRWEEREPVLYPDEMGDMFSGSAYVDSENASGLQEGEHAPVLLFYTAAGGVSEQSAGRGFTQCLAYSTDGGKTFRKYAGNPIMEAVGAENRDPKVTWASELSCYIMALYLEDSRYALFTSADLLNWSEFQTVKLAEESECPDFYPLYGENRERFWVLTGGEDRYTVGRLTADGFVPVQSVRPHHHGSRCSYAGQTFAFPDTEACGGIYPRRIRITYDKMHMPDSPFENQMGIPTEMSIVRTGEIYRLASRPVPEIEQLYEKTTERQNVWLGEREALVIPLDRCAHDITLESDTDGGEYDVTVFGVTLRIRPRQNRIVVSAHGDEYDMPVSYGGRGVSVRVIIDTAGIEIFADDGLVYSAAEATADFGMSYIRVSTTSGARISSVRAHALRTVYGQMGR